MTSSVDVRDGYPLSPVQRAVLAPGSAEADPAADLEQVRLVIRGRLRVAEFQQAWHRVIARHEILRTGFVRHDGREPVPVEPEPVQVVWPEAPPPGWHLDDLRTIRACQRRRGLAELLAADRVRGFALDVPPLCRFALLRVSETEHLLVWTAHHLVVDGWSLPILLGEALAEYRAAVEGRDAELPPPTPFRDHVAWSTARDLAEAEQFWRTELADLPSPVPLQRDLPDWRGEPADAFDEYSLELTSEDTYLLHETIGQQRLTLPAVVQGCWARLLAARGDTGAGTADVVIGATVAGRAGGPAAETLVGPLTNTVPVRVRIRPDQPVGVWLRGLQARQALARPFDHVPPALLRSWAGSPADAPLFASVLDFETYPMDNDLFTGTADASTISVRFDGRWTTSHHPLRLVVVPGERLGLHARYDLRQLGPETVESLLTELAFLLSLVATDPDRPVSALRPPDDGPLPTD
ncbi:condensation domain-containing protein [Plantactinospora sp. WMMB782]|uniref:condensation domain-containing protein n=1 Tax=Plantactinospora sp. WMMB782 TaxID=3404121 RepID=UPI003B956CD8